MDIIPLGDGKYLEYAMSLQHHGYEGKYKLFQLIPVEPQVWGEE